MSFLGAEIDGPMVVARAVHFAATAIVAGALTFRAVVADPALGDAGKVRLVVDGRIRQVAWIALVLSVVSGAVWLLLQTSSMSGQTCGEAVLSGALLTVLNETQVGLVAEIRLALALLLAICLACDSRPLPRWLAMGVALCLVAAIAWTGHAASTPHKLGYLHLTADALHLYAAAAWTGGLVSLVLLLTAVNRDRAGTASIELDAVRRFSALGMVSVATLIVSGVVNAWILVGSFRGLFLTDYGWILMAKLAAFAVMIAFATVNRFWLTPELAKPARANARRSLTRNAMAEIALVLLVFAIVGVLGTLHPAAHLVK
jgi:putative copper resistance protein D